MARFGPPNGGRVPEKSKDFKGSMKRLFANLEKWRYLFVFALVLAMVSAILSLNAPNKLSDFTDVITEGLTPNISENTFKDIMNDPEISYEDKIEAIIDNIHDNTNMYFQLFKLLNILSKVPLKSFTFATSLCLGIF